MYGRNIYVDQQVIINQQVLSGVTSFDGNFDIPYENIELMGGNFAAEVQGETSRNISINRFLIQSDPLKYLTGDAVCNGFVSYKGLSFGFLSGYLNSYSASCGIGDIASIKTDFTVYGNIGGGINQPILPSENTDNIYVANFGSIVVSADEGQTNRIVSFDYSVNCERVPIFVLGSVEPKAVFLKKPVKIQLKLNIEIDDYESDDIQNLLCNPNIQNLTVSLNNCDNSAAIETFDIPNARLISTNYTSSVENSTVVELSFISFLM
jgi:hypothetical protein